MDPLLVGLLTNLAHDVLTRGARLSLRTTVEDRLRAAAEATADEYHELKPDDLLGLFDSDAVDEQAASFREGAPLPLDDLVAALEDHPAELHLHGEPEEVIEDFLLAFEAELTSDRELCQQVILQYVKAQRTRLDVIRTWQETELETLQAAIEELKQEVTALEGLTDPADLDAPLGVLAASRWLPARTRRRRVDAGGKRAGDLCGCHQSRDRRAHAD